MIPIAKPIIAKEEKRAVREVLESGMLAQGVWVEQFEKEFSQFIGVRNAVATSNGTTALHLALLALGIGPGDEVITTPFSFIASANCILYTGAKPVFSDIDPITFNLDPDLIETKITPKTRAILTVHLFGLPADMPKIMKIAKRHRLMVIEDACQAHGAEIKGKKVGSIADVGCFSFYPTKNMTTAEGGMVTTKSAKIAQKIQLLRNHGMKIRYRHDISGYNFRLTNINAAIGREQLKKLNGFNKLRIRNAKILTKKLSKIRGVVTPSAPSNFKHVYHQYTLRITPEYKLSRDGLIEILSRSQIGSSIFYPIPIYKQRVFKRLGYKDNLPVTEQIAKEVLSIPVHPSLSQKDLEKITSMF